MFSSGEYWRKFHGGISTEDLLLVEKQTKKNQKKKHDFATLMLFSSHI